jgi:hypothetical protein
VCREQRACSLTNSRDYRVLIGEGVSTGLVDDFLKPRHTRNDMNANGRGIVQLRRKTARALDTRLSPDADPCRCQTTHARVSR